MRALTRHGYSTRMGDFYGPYPAKRVPLPTVHVLNVGFFRNRQAAHAACLRMAASFRLAAAKPMHASFEASRPGLKQKSRQWVSNAACHRVREARRLP